jgi:hypothetical protein
MRDIPVGIVPQGYGAGFFIYGEEDGVAVLGRRRGLSVYVYGSDFAGARDRGRPDLEADFRGEEREEREGHSVYVQYRITEIIKDVLFKWL